MQVNGSAALTQLRQFSPALHKGLSAALIAGQVGVANVAVGSIAAEPFRPSADFCPLLLQ